LQRRRFCQRSCETLRSHRGTAVPLCHLAAPCLVLTPQRRNVALPRHCRDTAVALPWHTAALPWHRGTTVALPKRHTVALLWHCRAWCSYRGHAVALRHGTAPSESSRMHHPDRAAPCLLGVLRGCTGRVGGPRGVLQVCVSRVGRVVLGVFGSRFVSCCACCVFQVSCCACWVCWLSLCLALFPFSLESCVLRVARVSAMCVSCSACLVGQTRAGDRVGSPWQRVCVCVRVEEQCVACCVSCSSIPADRERVERNMQHKLRQPDLQIFQISKHTNQM
jgi:hypothetical protein